MKNSTLKKVMLSVSMLCLALVMMMPMPVHAASMSDCSTMATDGLGGVVSCLIGVLNNVMILLVAGGVVFVAYGAFEMIASEEKRESGKQRIYHGIIGLFVMVSIWGFVNILENTFNLSGTVVTPPPLVNPSGVNSGPED